MLYLALAVAGLIPGAATVWLVRRRHGWITAVLAGAAVVVALPVTTVSALAVLLVYFPMLAVALSLAAVAAALHDYDSGRVWVATGWAAAAVALLSLAGWRAL
ncbi:hypothetical protein ABZ322_37695 [Streptomyces sp. NPDC006129]|uniref:hypothetical protein n=1 Tax=Streptomyces sp. NPDC006129 TaxID=3155348 RepID=UPI0033A60C0A